ncbi:MAG: hypothetical protein KF765_12285 [Parvibaculaceae bacterium]|nr:hypothetical protein [Parvibaculaceae bacterium]
MSDLAALGIGPLPKQEKAELPEALKSAPIAKVLLKYQARALQLVSTTALLVIEKSRRIGLTWGLAAHAALTAASQKSQGGMNVWYMGYDKDMAAEFIDAVAMFAKAFGAAAMEVDEEVFSDGNEKEAITGFRIRFASGFKVVALPSVARVLRGKQGLVIIDEAAFHKNLAEVIKAALALLIWGGRVVIVSTHDGVDNPFNLLLDDVRAGRRKGRAMRITFDEALEDGLYERVKMVSPPGSVPPKDEWVKSIRDTYGEDAEEELDCVPKTGAGAWLKPEDIAACEHPDAGKRELYQGGLVYIGRDVARRGDKAVIWPFEEVRGILWLRERYEERNATFAAQDEAMDGMFRFYRVARARVDQTGMGEKVVEDAQARHGDRVEGVLFTGPSKLDLASALRRRVESNTIRWPHSPIIRSDLMAVKRTGGSGSGLVEAGGVHPDLFWAAALACSAADRGVTQYAYSPVRNRYGIWPDDPDDDEPRGRGSYESARGLRSGGTW